jgi:DNA-binding response OmpR family regulator
VREVSRRHSDTAETQPDARTGSRILLVEDEPSLIVTLTDRLAAESYQVQSVTDGRMAVDRILSEPFDLVLLDVALPGMNGFDVCRELRRRGARLPILMLTARGEVADRVVGLKLGADDYLTKPFEMIELLARVEALLRRSSAEAAGSPGGYVFRDLRVDFRSARVFCAGKELALSAMEYKLLRYFIEHRGALLSREELLDKVWGYDATPSTRTVDVHVASLRQKLERNPAHPEIIVTVHRLGYRFAA